MASMTKSSQQDAVHSMFKLIDDNLTGELNACQVQAAHEMIRMGGISFQQVKAAMKYVCIDCDVCEEWELLDLMKEMDRRYFLVQDFRWEFSMLDSTNTDSITEEQAMWFLQSVHGEHFSRRNWEKFLKQRAAPGSRVAFPEIEVELCNVPCYADVAEEEEETKRLQSELENKKKKEQERRRLKEQQDKERQKLLEDQERIASEKNRAEQEEEERKRREEEKERRRLEKEEEERRRKLEEEQLERLRLEEEERRRREQEEAKNIEAVAQEAAEAEAEAERAALEAAEKLKRAEDAKSKKELEEAQAAAREKQKVMKEKKIRANLKVAIKIRKRPALKKSTTDFKKAKLQDHDGDLPKAERLLKLAEVKDKLKGAMANRQIKDLEDSMNNVKKHGFEQDLQPQMIEANNLLLRLRRLERIRAEILELKQSTVAEIRSYSSPPLIVHSVMIGTFLILGHAESETKEWKKVQALVGKTGKEGLKRRCLEYDPQTLLKKMEIANKARAKMSAFELDDVRDVSAGAATFYLWASNMIEEAEMMESQKNQAAEKKNDDDDDDI